MCAFLGRSDNIRNTHYPGMHKEVKPTTKTEYFLKVGQRPRLGANHVIAFLDHTGSTTLRPETKAMKASTRKSAREVSQEVADR